MKNTATRQPGLLARLWGRLRSDSGELLMESLGTLTVIAITLSAFSIAFIAMNQTQRTMHHGDIAAQAARGAIEQAKATDYNRLGFLTTDAGFRATVTEGPTTYNTVTITPADVVAGADRLLPQATTKIRGMDVTVRTDILATPKGREIIAAATYKSNGKTKTKTYKALVTPDLTTAAGAASSGVTEEPSAWPTNGHGD